MGQSFLNKRENALLVMLVVVVAGAAFICAASNDFSRPIFGVLSFAAIFGCFIELVMKPDLNHSYGFRDTVAVVGALAIGATIGEAIWLGFAVS